VGRPGYLAMFAKLKNVRPYHLLSLLVMLYIDVGMPLIHPLFHFHEEHDQSILACGGDSFNAPEDKGEAHHCHICDFKATNQLHAVESGPFVAADNANESINALFWFFLFRTCLKHVDARAPPTR